MSMKSLNPGYQELSLSAIGIFSCSHKLGSTFILIGLYLQQLAPEP
jgi:hypothetical protein